MLCQQEFVWRWSCEQIVYMKALACPGLQQYAIFNKWSPSSLQSPLTTAGKPTGSILSPRTPVQTPATAREQPKFDSENYDKHKQTIYIFFNLILTKVTFFALRINAHQPLLALKSKAKLTINTSNSSRHLNGDSMASHSDRMKQTVENDLSPPDRDFRSLASPPTPFLLGLFCAVFTSISSVCFTKSNFIFPVNDRWNIWMRKKYLEAGNKSGLYK